VRFGKTPDDGEAEAGAAGCAIARGIGPVEPIEDVRQVLRADAAAAVATAIDT